MTSNKKTMSDSILYKIRGKMCGKNAHFRFNQALSPLASKVNDTSIYIHIPFCKSLCPYCPYNRIPYEELKMNQYMNALEKEIHYFSESFGKKNISSVYIGGGTPILAGEKLMGLTKMLKDNYNIEGDMCIEANPNDITEESVKILKDSGFSTLSIGVQSFDDSLLKSIGRKYSSADAENAVRKAISAGFTSVNIDLLFALPEESDKQLDLDIEKAISLNPSQITVYPLFTFPYSEISAFNKIKSVKSPSILKRRKMYYKLYNTLENAGYERCSVWSFKKNSSVKRYSSVTRERYMGFGASAGSYHETHFDLNTFDVSEYIKSVEKKGHSTALRVKFTKRMAKLYDFYWRLYDTDIPMKRELALFSYSIAGERDLVFYMKLMLYLKLAYKNKEGFSLTERGSLWVHFLQNLMSLRAINIVWGKAKNQAWPKRIDF